MTFFCQKCFRALRSRRRFTDSLVLEPHQTAGFLPKILIFQNLTRFFAKNVSARFARGEVFTARNSSHPSLRGREGVMVPLVRDLTRVLVLKRATTITVPFLCKCGAFATFRSVRTLSSKTGRKPQKFRTYLCRHESLILDHTRAKL